MFFKSNKQDRSTMNNGMLSPLENMRAFEKYLNDIIRIPGSIDISNNSDSVKSK